MRGRVVLLVTIVVLVGSCLLSCARTPKPAEIPGLLMEAQALVPADGKPTPRQQKRITSLYESVLRADPDNPYALNNLGWLVLSTEGYTKEPVMRKGLDLFQRAYAHSAGKKASAFVRVAFLPPERGPRGLVGDDFGEFAFLMLGVAGYGGQQDPGMDIDVAIARNAAHANWQLLVLQGRLSGAQDTGLSDVYDSLQTALRARRPR